MLDHAFRRASEEEMFQPGVAVRRHHDQIRRKFFCEPADFVKNHGALAKMEGPRGRQFTAAGEFLQHTAEVFPAVFFKGKERAGPPKIPDP